MALILATVASWILSRDAPLGERFAVSVVIAIAFVKVRLVGRYFMELRTAPRFMRAAFDLWLLIAAAVLIWLACFGSGLPAP